METYTINMKTIDKIFLWLFVAIGFAALIAVFTGATHHWVTILMSGVVVNMFNREIKGKTITIAGLEWDRKNLCKHKDFDSAQGVAAGFRKRIPTDKEWKRLGELPNCWNPIRNGRHYGRKYWWQFWKDALFLPASGATNLGGAHIYKGIYGNYWSSTHDGSANGYYWRLYSSNGHLGYCNKKYRLSVRCVQDIKR